MTNDSPPMRSTFKGIDSLAIESWCDYHALTAPNRGRGETSMYSTLDVQFKLAIVMDQSRHPHQLPDLPIQQHGWFNANNPLIRH
ncbi:hypothetical protein M378DRAFT_166102 [Amanita muscaria Koide BX008]|uniref:Uncharacterized protein n=1 Tax=Amanita muscaria (strain Koide BX008) TaxID=946122 RepID=A0A0C2SG90_AMAMK|nr:hypothetical protein M378DRAFT_166102 [Amanita muscaria Koide BX008]